MSNVIIHHHHNIFVRNAILVKNLISMASISLWETIKKKKKNNNIKNCNRVYFNSWLANNYMGRQQMKSNQFKSWTGVHRGKLLSTEKRTIELNTYCICQVLTLEKLNWSDQASLLKYVTLKVHLEPTMITKNIAVCSIVYNITISLETTHGWQRGKKCCCFLERHKHHNGIFPKNKTEKITGFHYGYWAWSETRRFKNCQASITRRNLLPFHIICPLPR